MYSLISPLTNNLVERLKEVEDQRIITAFPRFDTYRWVYEFGSYFNERANTLNIDQPFAKIQAESNYWVLHSKRHVDIDLIDAGPQKELYQRADRNTILQHEKDGILSHLQPGDIIFYDHPHILDVEYDCMPAH